MSRLMLLGRTCLLSLLLAAMVSADTHAARTVEVDGLRRVSTAAFLGTLPGVEGGRTTEDFDTGEAIRALYATGLFQDVQVYQTAAGAVLFEVAEYAVIDRVSYSGNSRIPSEVLDSALEDIEVVEGLSYQPAVLAEIQRELEGQYAAQGRYNASVNVSVDPLPQNRVAIIIDIDEGSAAAIRSIELRGNDLFESDEILRDTRLRARRPSDPLQLFSRRYEYDRDTYAGDLERINSYYLNRGYVRFNIDNSQISLEPDKSGVHLLTEISEGERYRWGEVSVSGSFAGFEDEIRAALRPVEGEWFNRSELVDTQNEILDILGDDGYLFAEAEPQASIDDSERIVDLEFVVRPGNQMFVRHIHFEGNQGTLDEVLRREMRIFEGELARRSDIATSRRRLQQLGFFRQVNVSQDRVPGTENQVDITFTVEEDQTGTVQASLGFQPGVGMFSSLEFRQDNFLGTGKNVSLKGQFGQDSTIFNLSHEDPYFTKSGISRDLSVFYERTNWLNRNVATYGLDRWGGEFILGRPVGNNSRISAGVGFTQHDLYLGDFPPVEVTDFVDENGRNYADWTTELRWDYSDQIGSFYATEGQRHRLNLSVTIPGSDLNYYRLSYRGDYVQPLNDGGDYALRFLGQAGYGAGYGDTSQLPFYKNFYAGGPGTVRGYRDRTVSPFGTNPEGATISPRPLGGDALLSTGAELIIPTPLARDQSVFRTAVFTDVGAAFNTADGLEPDDFRASYGIDLVWRPIPMLPLRFIYARPILEQDGDELDRFRFTFWSNF
ncbi:MAG: outer membrane protein assembly factor BamA [Natronospirillum sp.]|uniref:outer membrane protein assembly factor BamA n=1 Tax=Natronospirillum sp. TaxID=2812955 RepID=UPI0025CD2BA2|nr:outer membrane protein assembly factor BamA [Natronospirillum sp.]MCH8552327.1 outer membrane protein assembly factor BamA [Natronospirillum sp.]